MEEKNKIIISYIENRLQELDRMGMDVPENNVNKLYSVFLNRVEDINIIKTKIDNSKTENIRKEVHGFVHLFSFSDEIPI